MSNIWAAFVTPENLKLIADLNEGIYPEKECLDEATYFVHPDNDNDYNQLITDEIFHDNYVFLDPTIPLKFTSGLNLVKEI